MPGNNHESPEKDMVALTTSEIVKDLFQTWNLIFQRQNLTDAYYGQPHHPVLTMVSPIIPIPAL